MNRLPSASPLAAFCALWVSSAYAAEPLTIITDIPPTSSLLQNIADERSTIVTLLPKGDPHHGALRPSQLKALREADLIVITSYGLTPWLSTPITAHAKDVPLIELMEIPQTLQLPFRRWAEDAHNAGDAHDHDHEHEHGDIDPHGWLSAANWSVWSAALSDALAKIDPENAPVFTQNAEEFSLRAQTLLDQTKEALAPHQGAGFVIYHDAFQYFEKDAGIAPQAAATLSDAADPGAAHLRELRHAFEAQEITCIFYDTSAPIRMIERLTEGTQIKSARLDPLGQAQPMGPELLPDLYAQISHEIAGCLAQ